MRTAIMETFGYFHTESSHHASEYTPWFRKTPEDIAHFIENRWDYYEICQARDFASQTEEARDRLLAGLERSLEYGALIVDAMETGEPVVIYGNVPNHGLIDNLPAGCCVEVACLVDGNGVQPTHAGALPPQCAALNRTNINVQELAVRAALDGELEHIYRAVALDPLTGAVMTLDRVRAMTDELLAAHAGLLPETLRPA